MQERYDGDLMGKRMPLHGAIVHGIFVINRHHTRCISETECYLGSTLTKYASREEAKEESRRALATRALRPSNPSWSAGTKTMLHVITKYSDAAANGQEYKSGGQVMTDAQVYERVNTYTQQVIANMNLQSYGKFQYE